MAARDERPTQVVGVVRPEPTAMEVGSSSSETKELLKTLFCGCVWERNDVNEGGHSLEPITVFLMAPFKPSACTLYA